MSIVCIHSGPRGTFCIHNGKSVGTECNTIRKNALAHSMLSAGVLLTSVYRVSSLCQNAYPGHYLTCGAYALGGGRVSLVPFHAVWQPWMTRLPKEGLGLPKVGVKVAKLGPGLLDFRELWQPSRPALNTEQAFDGVFRLSLYECGKKL
jgi:hypothetical protein